MPAVLEVGALLSTMLLGLGLGLGPGGGPRVPVLEVVVLRGATYKDVSISSLAWGERGE